MQPGHSVRAIGQPQGGNLLRKPIRCVLAIARPSGHCARVLGTRLWCYREGSSPLRIFGRLWSATYGDAEGPSKPRSWPSRALRPTPDGLCSRVAAALGRWAL